MASERLVQRFYGSENEYGFTKKDPSNNLPSTLKAPGIKQFGKWLENGACLYPDVGYIEYATAECPTLHDLVLQELAGEIIVGSLREVEAVEVDGKLKMMPVGLITGIYKQSRSPNTKYTSGSHENYSTTVDIWNSDMKERDIATLAAFFATRSPIVGAGFTHDRGFSIAQKMGDITEVMGTKATSDKTLVNKREEHHAGGSRLHRLHVVCGDSNMSPFAFRMKFGMTSLVLRLMEHGVDLSALHLRDPLESAHLIGAEINNMIKPVELVSGKQMSALDIQLGFIDAVDKLKERVQLPEEELEVLQDWKDIVELLYAYATQGKEHRMLDQLDWYKKKQIVDRVKEEKNHQLRITQIQQIEAHYAEVPEGFATRLREPGRSHSLCMPDEKEVLQSVILAPPGRGRFRGALIKSTYTDDGYVKSTIPISRITWEEDVIRGKLNKRPLHKPYKPEYVEKVLGEAWK